MFAIKLLVLSGAEVINFAMRSQIFGSESANAGIDAGGAALDCPQNVLPDVPVLPLCCPRQRLWAPEDRRMLPSHEGGARLLVVLSVSSTLASFTSVFANSVATQVFLS